MGGTARSLGPLVTPRRGRLHRPHRRKACGGTGVLHRPARGKKATPALGVGGQPLNPTGRAPVQRGGVGAEARQHLVDDTRRRGVATQVEGANPVGRRTEGRPADGGGPPGDRGIAAGGVVEDRGAGQQHRHGVGDVLAHQRGRGPVRSLRHGHDGLQVVVERQQDGLGAGDGAEEGQHQVREAVAVAVQGRDHQRAGARLGEEAGVGGVDQRRAVRDVGVAGGGGVHLLFQHPLVDGRHRPLRSPVDARIQLHGGAERVLRHGSAHRAVDALGPPGLLARAARGRPSAPPPHRRHRRRPCAPPRSGGRRTPGGRRPGCAVPCAR